MCKIPDEATTPELHHLVTIYQMHMQVQHLAMQTKEENQECIHHQVYVWVSM